MCVDIGKEFLFNPVSKTYYVDYSYSYTLHSNKYALYRIVNPDGRDNNVRYYAITEDQLYKVPQHSFLDEFELDEYKNYSVVEIFKYNPNWLSKGKYIDPISLYAQFKGTEDIKTRIALRDMLKETIGLDIC